MQVSSVDVKIFSERLLESSVSQNERVSHSVVSDPMDCVARQAPRSMGFSRPKYWSGSHSLFQGIFPIQGWNLGLLHCREILYHLKHQGRLFPYKLLTIYKGEKIPLQQRTWPPSVIQFNITGKREKLAWSYPLVWCDGKYTTWPLEISCQSVVCESNHEETIIHIQKVGHFVRPLVWL